MKTHTIHWQARLDSSVLPVLSPPRRVEGSEVEGNPACPPSLKLWRVNGRQATTKTIQADLEGVTDAEQRCNCYGAASFELRPMMGKVDSDTRNTAAFLVGHVQ